VSYGAEAWTLTNKEEQAVLIFERKIFRRIYGPKYENGEWESRTNRELEEMSKGQNIVKWIKVQRISWLGHLERMEEDRMSKNMFQNNYQQDDTYGLSFISRLVVLHSTCFELQGAHHQEFTFFSVQAVSGILCNLLLYSTVLLRVTFCSNGWNTAKDYTVCQRLPVQKKKWTPDDELPEARNM